MSNLKTILSAALLLLCLTSQASAFDLTREKTHCQAGCWRWIVSWAGPWPTYSPVWIGVMEPDPSDQPADWEVRIANVVGPGCDTSPLYGSWYDTLGCTIGQPCIFGELITTPVVVPTCMTCNGENPN